MADDISIGLEALGKLADVVRLMLGPRYARKQAGAEAEGAVIKAEAEARGAVIRAEGEAMATVIRAQGDALAEEIQTRARWRLEEVSLRRQRNLERIVDVAARLLPKRVSSEPVEDDWVSEFANNSQDVADADMQSLWARILAGEVERPGTFSRRTLHLVRLLSKRDAEVFTRFCSLVWRTGARDCFVANAGPPILLDPSHAFNFYHYGVGNDEVRHLVSIGLVESASARLYGFASGPVVVSYHDRRYSISGHSPEGGLSFDAYLLTETGQELALISGSTANERYLAATLAEWKRHGLGVEPLDD